MAITARTEMLIRAPASAVYRAFVEPAWLRRFWLRKASGPLQLGKKVRWEFRVPGARDTVEATHLVKGRRIAFRWSDGKSVDIRLSRLGRATRAAVQCTGFSGKSAAAEAIGATGGFSIVLCDLKSLLESGVSAGMVRDAARMITADLKRSSK